jgi:hypothetical protein
MCNIKFGIIFKTYIYMQGSSCSTFTLTLTLIPRNLRKKNPNPNPKNPRKEIKSFFETNHL